MDVKPLVPAANALGFKSSKTGANGKTNSFTVQQSVCMQIFGSIGITITLLCLLLQNAQLDVHRSKQHSDLQSQLVHNERQSALVSGTEDALDQEAFQQQNLEFVKVVRSQNARMSMALSKFLSDIDKQVDEIDDTHVRGKLHGTIVTFTKSMKYRLKTVRKIVQADNEATKNRLGHVDEKIAKLLKKTEAVKQEQKMTTAKRQQKMKKNLRSWAKTAKGKKHTKNTKKISTSSSISSIPSMNMRTQKGGSAKSIAVKLKSFAEFKKEHEKNQLPAGEKDRAALQALHAKLDAGSKRAALENSHSKIQLQLQKMFQMAHDLPTVTVNRETEQQWSDLLEKYQDSLKQDSTQQEVADRLRALNQKMQTVLGAPDVKRYLRTMFSSRMFASIRTQKLGSLGKKFEDEQVRLHPFSTLKHLYRTLNFTKGKPLLLQLERDTIAGKIDTFQAWTQLRQLMKRNQAPLSAALAIH